VISPVWYGLNEQLAQSDSHFLESTILPPTPLTKDHFSVKIRACLNNGVTWEVPSRGRDLSGQWYQVSGIEGNPLLSLGARLLSLHRMVG